MAKSQIVTPGLHVQVTCSVVNLEQKVKVRDERTVSFEEMSVEDLWNYYDPANLRNRSSNQATSTEDKDGKKKYSTISSGWVQIHANLSGFIVKANDLPNIAKAAGESSLADDRVSEFKKNAESVWKKYAQFKELTVIQQESLAAEINALSCVVYKIRVYLQQVSRTPIGAVQPGEDGLARATRCVRSFYVTKIWASELLKATAQMLASDEIRSDRRTKPRVVYNSSKLRYGIAVGELHEDKDKRVAELAASLKDHLNSG